MRNPISLIVVLSIAGVLTIGPRLAAQDSGQAPPVGLKSEDPKERAKAAKELAKKGTPSDVPALAALINDPEADVPT